MKLLQVLILSASLALPSLCRAESDIFWEAESADETNMPIAGPSRPLSPEEAEKLSGGAWLNGKSVEGGSGEIFADYTLNVPTAGNYSFFARKFWQHGAFRWRIDGGEWHEVRKTTLLDSVTMREYIPINWVYLEEVVLTAGEHKLRIEVVEDPDYEFSKAYAFDCFLLTRGRLEDYLDAHPEIKGEPR